MSSSALKPRSRRHGKRVEHRLVALVKKFSHPLIRFQIKEWSNISGEYKISDFSWFGLGGKKKLRKPDLWFKIVKMARWDVSMTYEILSASLGMNWFYESPGNAVDAAEH